MEWKKTPIVKAAFRLNSVPAPSRKPAGPWYEATDVAQSLIA
jgi:hypothetical protein